MQRFEDAFQKPFGLGTQTAEHRDAIVAWARADLSKIGMGNVAKVVGIATRDVYIQYDDMAGDIRFTLQHPDKEIASYTLVARKEAGDPFVHWIVKEGDEEGNIYSDDEFADCLAQLPAIRAANAANRIGFRRNANG